MLLLLLLLLLCDVPCHESVTRIVPNSTTRTPAGFKGPTSKGREGTGGKGGRGRKGMGGKVSEREGPEGKKCKEFHHLLLNNLTTACNHL